MTDIHVLSKTLRADIRPEATHEEQRTACAAAAAGALIDQVASEDEAVQHVRNCWRERYPSTTKRGEPDDPWPLASVEAPIEEELPPLSEMPFMKG